MNENMFDDSLFAKEANEVVVKILRRRNWGGKRKGAGRKPKEVKTKNTTSIAINHKKTLIEAVKNKYKGNRGEFNKIGRKWLESLLTSEELEKLNINQNINQQK